MTLEQMRYVVAISQYGSITAAAESLFMAQPSLSRAVKELEQELGITVLERSRRGTSFTAKGLKLLEYACQILEQTDRCREYFQNLNTAQNVLSLRISMHHYIFPVDALINAINRLGTPRPTYSPSGNARPPRSSTMYSRSKASWAFCSSLT